MFYDFAITVSANTLEASPKTQVLKLTAGVIQQVSILFPPGPHGMVKVRLLHGSHQFIPLNTDGYVSSDDESLDIPEFYPLDAEPYELKFIGYSPGTTYDHTIYIRINVLRPEDVEKTSGIMVQLKRLLKFMGVG